MCLVGRQTLLNQSILNFDTFTRICCSRIDDASSSLLKMCITRAIRAYKAVYSAANLYGKILDKTGSLEHSRRPLSLDL